MKIAERTLAQLLQTVGEKQRLRILCVLYREEEKCVSEIAHLIEESVATTSHHLNVLSDAGILEKTRNGKNICYKPAKTLFTKELKKLICSVSTI